MCIYVMIYKFSWDLAMSSACSSDPDQASNIRSTKDKISEKSTPKTHSNWPPLEELESKTLLDDIIFKMVKELFWSKRFPKK